MTPDSQPPTRPTTEPTESARTLDRLRAVASDLLARRGYGGTSMSEIAAGVGVRKASLYNYYASKEELLLDLVDRSLTAWRDASRPALDREGDTKTRLHEHLMAAVDFAVGQPEKIAILRVASTQIGGELGRRVADRLDEMKVEYLDRMEGFFREAIERGEVVDAEPMDLALTHRAFLDGLLSNLIFRPEGGASFFERLPQLWEVLWRGLSGAPSSGESR